MASAASAPSDLLGRALALQELDRRECAADAQTFMERHVSIEEPDGRVIPLHLWSFQREVITALDDDLVVIVLKARRLGLSWIVLAYALWLAIFQQGVRILVLCKTEADASELLDRIRRMRDRIAADPTARHLLAGLKQPAKARDAVTTLDVGQSTIRALVGTEQAARSETAGLVVLDEFAFQRQAAGIWRAILPTIEGGGRLAVVSTGDGTTGNGKEFADQWARAASGKSPLRPLFFPWSARPDRDEAWKERTIAQLGDPVRFAAEYPEVPDDAFQQPDSLFVFDRQAIAAAERLGRQFDEARKNRTMPPPVNSRMACGVDWGDFRSHAVPVWELERGGLYIPPGEVGSTQADVEDIARAILASVGAYDYWFAEERYDASFKQSNRTFARVAEQLHGPHNPIKQTGRPNTVPVPFQQYKSLTVAYLRALLRRTLAGETVRIIAISPANTTLLEQMRTYQQKEDGSFEKGNDDAVDSLIAGAAPLAKRHRDLVDREQAAAA